MDWYAFKTWLEVASRLDMDALHDHAGLLLQLLAALALRRSIRSPWPWLAVLVATLANEAYDMHYETWPDPERASQWAEGAKDLVNSLFIPSLLLMLARCAPWLLTGDKGASSSSPELAPQRPFP